MSTIRFATMDAHVRLYQEWFLCAYRANGLEWRKQACSFCAYGTKCL